MRYRTFARQVSSLTAVVLTAAWTVATTAETIPPVDRAVPEIPLTLVKEARAALSRGARFLVEKQSANGSWLHAPAVTAQACMALNQCEAQQLGVTRQMAVDKGRQFILKNVHEDGAICSPDRSYVSYSTSICLSALAILQDARDIDVMRRARRFLVGSQLDEDHADHPTSKDNPFYGGIGYGSQGQERPDLSNTQWALEALYLTEGLDKEPFLENPEDAKQADLAWQKALSFLAAVQNIEKTRDGAWVVTDDKDGGFIYQPDQSKASQENGDGQALRSYGSMTYAGIKSMLYAKLQRDDPRVRAAVDWARRHYTLDENPGVGPEGHYYYLHTFAKAHAVFGEEAVTTANGETRQWRTDLIRKLLQLQKGNGEWANDKSGRWQESIPELVTTYAMMGVEIALGDRVREE